jgi:hypothetical protein
MFELVVFSGFEVTERAPYLVHDQATSWGMDRCSS